MGGLQPGHLVAIEKSRGVSSEGDGGLKEFSVGGLQVSVLLQGLCAGGDSVAACFLDASSVWFPD